MNLKKILAGVLACCIMGGALPYTGGFADYSAVTVSAAEDENILSGECGDNVTWNFDRSTGTMTISGSGDMYDYFDFKPWYFNYETGETLVNRSDIKSVVVEDTVTYIGDFAFYGHDNITSVTLPDGIGVGLYSFAGTPWLSENIVMENGLGIINDILFDGYSCEGDVVIPNKIKSIAGGAFTIGSMGGRLGTDKITSVTLPEGLKSIGHDAFYECINLTSIYITSSVTSIDGSFAGCPNLLFRVDENNQYYSSDEYGVLFNKDKTVLINYPKNSKQESYAIPDSVTSIDYGVFSGCTNLTTVIIPDSVTSIGFGAFADCTNLTSITIPDSVTIIYNEAFEFCPKLTSVTIPDSVTEIRQWAFKECKSLESITILNPECIINDDPETICNDDVYPDRPYSGVIKGYNNSTAEKYAKKCNRTFESLGDPPKTTTTTATTTATSTSTTTTSTTTTTTATTSTTTSTATAATATTIAVNHIASDDDLCTWAISDYQSKTGVTASSAKLTVGVDGMYVIALSDESGKLLNTYTIDPETGIGTDSANDEVDLPQTGNNSLNSILLALGAFLMVCLGAAAVKTSGSSRRKNDE